MKKVLTFLRNLFSKARKIKVNKYYLTAIIFLIITFCIGDSTLRRRYQYDKQIKELESEIVKYTTEKAANEQKLNDLKSDNESLERFAREKYLMTKPNEELFVIK